MLERRTARSKGQAGAVALFVLALGGMAGCSTKIEGPTPKLDAKTTPEVACNASNAENQAVRTTIRITSPDGTFSPLPVETLNDKQTVELPKVYLIQGTTETEVPDIHFVDTKNIDVIIDADPLIPAGEYQFKVVNANGYASNVAGKLRIVDPPTVTGVSAQSNIPNGSGAQICTSIDNTLTITGTGFRTMDAAPAVEILSCTDPKDTTTCTTVAGKLGNVTVVSDTSLTGTLVGGMSGLAPGAYAVRVTNPEVPPCTGTMAEAVFVVPNPTITSVAPPSVCAADAEITITGTGFHNPMTGTVGDQPLGMPNASSDTTMTGTVPMLPLGTYPVSVTIPEGCTASLPDALTVSSSTSMLTSIIPTQGWNGIDNPVIVFGSGFVTGDQLLLAGAATGGGDLALTNEIVDATGTRIDGFVPQGGMEGGPYDLVLQTANGCFATLPMAFTILGKESLTVSDVIPPYGWTGTKTPVSIRGAMFQSTPKAYLVIPTLNPQMVPLKSTAFVNDSSLTSVVPAGLPVGGPYDVAVINPDGGGGLKKAAFRVTMLPPPTIDNVTPAAGTTQSPTTVTITGCNFRDPATVDLVAQNGTTTAAMVTAAPVCNGAPGCPDNTNHCTMTATIPSPTLAVAPYVVRVTNTDEMTYGEYSLFVVTQPSAKLNDWKPAAVKLNTGRRGHAGVAGRVDNASRFLYAIGGDTGNGGMVLDSVEAIPVDIFGTLGTPFVGQNKLKAARTGVSAVESNGYIYVVGGTTNGMAPLGSIERAKILTDDDVPQVNDPTVGAGALPKGTWYYRVSAVKDAADPDNPDGETLPSDEVVVSLAIDGNVSLSWAAVMGAKAYRVYRTEAANGTSTTEVFLTEVTTTTFVDDGSLMVDTARKPLLRGSTGVWVTLGNALVHARRDLGTAIAHDPNGAAFVYAVGGQGDCMGGMNVAPMNCYEFASISADGKTLGTWTAGTQNWKSPRAIFGLAAGENANASQIPAGTAYLFAAGGLNSTSELEAAKVLADGQLEASQVLAPPNGSKPGARNGHGFQLVNNAMYLIDGVSGTAASGPPLASTQFSVDFGNPVPTRSSFSNSASAMITPRWRHATVLTSGFFYLIGGSSDATLTNATDTIEQTIF